MAGIEIRKLTPDDRDEWSQMWTSYLEFYNTSVSEEVYETSFNRLLSSDAGEYNCLIAEIDGSPVGLAHYLFHRFMWSVEDTCYLMDLFSKPEIRGQGVGRSLIEGVHAEAKKRDIPSTYWVTQEFNYKGRMLYDQVANRTPFIMYSKGD